MQEGYKVYKEKVKGRIEDRDPGICRMLPLTVR